MTSHCYHRTGAGSRHEAGGAWEVLCCWCAKRSEQRWYYVPQTLYGHGPEFYKRVAVDEPIADETPCPGR